MRRAVLPILGFLLFVLPAGAQLSLGGPGPASEPPKVTIEGSVQSREGDVVTGVIVATVAEGWHINSAKPLDEFAIPTALSFDPATAELLDVTYPQHAMKAFQFTGGSKIAVYDGKFQLPFKARVKGGGQSIAASLRYQACSDNICLPPADAKAQIAVTPVAAPAPPAAASGTAAPSSSSFTPLSAAPPDAKPSGDRLSNTFASRGLPLTLLILFVGGLALNLTPCVLPLVPITLGFFAMQSDGRRSRRFALSAMYVVGLVLMYSTLGVVAAIGGKMFGAWLQLPAVLIGFALLMLVLASSMFGAFEIQPPRWIANRSQGRAGLAGALTMGLIVGIVAAPCVGPVVISLLTLVAQIGKPVIGGVMFGALAFGLGFPYLALLNVLPKPGEWMVQVKKGMGFVLVAMAFYFIRPLTGDEVYRWGVALSLLAGAAYLFFISTAARGKTMRIAIAILLLAGGVAFAIPRNDRSAVDWKKYDAKEVAEARAAGKPVVIDFYADWCLPCKELDQKTFTNEAVGSELERFARFKADLTAPDDETTRALTGQYGILGVPTIVFLDSSGREARDVRLTGFEGPEKFVARAKKVR